MFVIRNYTDILQEDGFCGDGFDKERISYYDAIFGGELSRELFFRRNRKQDFRNGGWGIPSEDGIVRGNFTSETFTWDKFSTVKFFRGDFSLWGGGGVGFPRII